MNTDAYQKTLLVRVSTLEVRPWARGCFQKSGARALRSVGMQAIFLLRVGKIILLYAHASGSFYDRGVKAESSVRVM